jgi:signal transduction histidine kinase
MSSIALSDLAQSLLNTLREFPAEVAMQSARNRLPKSLLALSIEQCAQEVIYLDKIRKTDRFLALAHSTVLTGMDLSALTPTIQAKLLKLHGLLSLNVNIAREAYDASHRAIAIFQNARESDEVPYDIAESYSQAGTAARNLGLFPEALSNFLASRRCAQECPAPLLAAWQLFRLGKMYLNYLEQPSRGYKLISDAHVEFLSIPGDKARRAQAACLDELGDIFRQHVRNIEKASTYYESARVINTEMSNDSGLSRNIAHLGLCAEALGRLDEASLHLGRSVSLLRALPAETRGLGIRLGQFSRIRIAAGDLKTAEPSLSEATEISLLYRDFKSQAQHELTWAQFKRAQHRPSLAKDHLERAISLASDHHLYALRISALEALADIARDDFGDYHKSRELLLTSAEVKLSAWEQIRSSNPTLEEVEDRDSIGEMYRSLFERLLEDYQSTLHKSTDAAALALRIAVSERDQKFEGLSDLFRFGAYMSAMGHELINLIQRVNSEFDELLATTEVGADVRHSILAARRDLADGVSVLREPAIFHSLTARGSYGNAAAVGPTLTVLVRSFVDKGHAAGIRFSFSGVEDLDGVKADSSILRIVLKTLLDNALDSVAGIADGYVELTGSVLDRQNQSGVLMCIVKDNGPGMNQEMQEKIFSIGFTTKANHLGLGLPTVHFLLETIGGGLECHSEPGSGTQFTVNFPVRIEVRTL